MILRAKWNEWRKEEKITVDEWRIKKKRKMNK